MRGKRKPQAISLLPLDVGFDFLLTGNPVKLDRAKTWYSVTFIDHVWGKVTMTGEGEDIAADLRASGYNVVFVD